MKTSGPVRTRRLRRICLSLEVEEFAGEIIVDLLDEMEEMRRDLERLRQVLEIRQGRETREN